MKNVLTIILISLSLLSIAQSSHISLNMGSAYPLGDYAKSENYLTNGYANPGFNLSFDGNYIPTWYVGIGGALNFATNVPQSDSMLNGLIEELNKMDIPDITENIDVNFSFGNWNYVNLLVGPTLAYPAGKLQFNLKALIGMSVIMEPNQTINLSYDTNVISGYSNAQKVNFCYSAGADIIFKLNEEYSLKLGTEYFSTKMNYDVDFAFSEDTQNLTPISRSINVSSLHTNIGIAYLF